MYLFYQLKATGGTNYISKFANYTTPWNNDAEGYKVVVGEHQRLLKYFSRLEIKAEIIRCQNELWIPPVKPILNVKIVLNYSSTLKLEAKKDPSKL